MRFDSGQPQSVTQRLLAHTCVQLYDPLGQAGYHRFNVLGFSRKLFCSRSRTGGQPVPVPSTRLTCWLQIRSVVMPNLVWRAGRVCGAMRTVLGFTSTLADYVRRQRQRVYGHCFSQVMSQNRASMSSLFSSFLWLVTNTYMCSAYPVNAAAVWPRR